MIRWFKAKACSQDRAEPSRPVIRARPFEIVVWLVIAAAWTAIWCWASVLLAERFAPVIVLPLLTGLVLGAGCVLAMRPAGLASRPWLLGGTLVLSLALAAGQHFVWYHITQAKIEEGYTAKLSGNQLSGMVAAIPELHPSFEEFLRSTADRGRAWFTLRLHGGWVWASWALDAALQSAAAVGLVWFAARQAYCPRCRSWYRPVRSGKLTAQQATALAALYGCESSPPDQYRLMHCQSGCGPMRLEMLGTTSAGHRSAWLDDDTRHRVLELLNEPVPSTDAHTSSAADPTAVEKPQ
ncbi:MAG TPA: hypothetical protein VHV55_02890 [Pirellulales bacterium]|jgi:hypothetical protein|nr:hypothetical protein [Pirellulales bacterium]